MVRSALAMYVLAAAEITTPAELSSQMLPDCPAVMLVKVSAAVVVGVHLKKLVAFMSNDRSLSVVTVPLNGAVSVSAVSALRMSVSTGS